MVEFNHSPLGQKMIEKTPELAKKSIKVMQNLMKDKIQALKSDLDALKDDQNKAM